jgi:hypothetical protein
MCSENAPRHLQTFALVTQEVSERGHVTPRYGVRYIGG